MCVCGCIGFGVHQHHVDLEDAHYMECLSPWPADFTDVVTEQSNAAKGQTTIATSIFQRSRTVSEKTK
eukprot:4873345-Amphidinium_carterae.1